ncbi:copper chaperone PCu(A)C [Geodermatophilus sp. SYSU D00965]
MSPSGSARRLPLPTLAVVLALAGCAGDELPDVDDSGAVGPDVVVDETIKLLQVQLEFPLDGVHEEGEDARLFLAIANDGSEADTLLDVRGPDFTDAELVAGGAPGTIAVPPDDNVYVGAEGAPSVVLEDLRTPLRSSQSIPVTFVFEDAGEVTVEAVVAAEGEDPAAPFDFPDPAEDVDP